MKVNTADCGKRGYIWFCDISFDGGLRVGTPAVRTRPCCPGDWVPRAATAAPRKSENLVILRARRSLTATTRTAALSSKNPGLLEDGTLVDELYVYLDPAELEHAENSS